MNFTRDWALVKSGVVTALLSGPHDAGQPFGDLADDHRAIDVTGVVCHVGYVADSFGNVASRIGSVPPAPGEPAYHDTYVPPAIPTAEQAKLIETSGPATA